MAERTSDPAPALYGRRNRMVDDQEVDEVRRVLWRAFQHGGERGGVCWNAGTA
jgi:hypothetical protein